MQKAYNYMNEFNCGLDLLYERRVYFQLTKGERKKVEEKQISKLNVLLGF